MLGGLPLSVSGQCKGKALVGPSLILLETERHNFLSLTLSLSLSLAQSSKWFHIIFGVIFCACFISKSYCLIFNTWKACLLVYHQILCNKILESYFGTKSSFGVLYQSQSLHSQPTFILVV